VDKQTFYTKAYADAMAAHDPWPEYSIVDAAMESGWGESDLAQHNNLLGQKQGHVTAHCQTIDIPTHEEVRGKMVPLGHCIWPVFSSWEECFSARLALLHSMDCYKPALAATSGEAFILALEHVWASDTKKASEVIAQHARDAAIIAKIMANYSTP
jgi:flagellum-specific peptidoglycan hydrolase FlgJ